MELHEDNERLERIADAAMEKVHQNTNEPVPNLVDVFADFLGKAPNISDEEIASCAADIYRATERG